MVRQKKLNPKEIKEAFDNINDSPFNPRNFEEPQEGLLPIPNTPFYATPDEPASPFDCDRYPDSLYCGQPFTKIPIGLEPSIVYDSCNVGIQLSPTFGFIKLPPVQIVYRLPSCRKFEKKEPIPPSDPAYQYIPLDEPTEAGCLYSFVVAVDYSESYYDFQTGKYVIKRHAYPNGIATVHRGYAWGEVTGLRIETTSRQLDSYFDEENGIRNIRVTSRASIVCKVNPETNLGIAREQLNASNVDIGLYNLGDSYPYSKRVSRLSRTVAPTFWEYNRVYTVENHGNLNLPPPVWRIIGIKEIWCDRSTLNKIPPAPPLDKRCNCDMTCCPSSDQNDQLLRSLIRKVDKLSKIIGVDEYPASVPDSFISKDEGFIGNLIPNFNKSIPNLTQFLVWYVERFDEIMGQWEIPIEIKDSDPSKPGDQPLGVRLPNMAEAIGEMFTLAFQTNLNSETLLNFAVRNAAESISDKQQNYITYKLLQSLTDYIGYKQKDINVKMPSLFKLGKTRYDEILQESEIDVPVTELDEKFNLEADLMKFRESAAILAANYKRKINPSLDIKQQILNQLLEAYRSANKVNGEDDGDFDAFLQQVEKGYGDIAGVTDPTKPYGRDYTERPKIRDLTNYEKPTED